MGTSIKLLRIGKLRQSITQSLQVRRKDRKMLVKFNLLHLKKAKNLSTEQLRAVQLAIHQPTVITEAEKNKIVNSLFSIIRTLFIKTRLIKEDAIKNFKAIMSKRTKLIWSIKVTPLP